MRNCFTVMVQFCHIEPDLANRTLFGTLVLIKHLLVKSEATAAGRKCYRLISPDPFEVPQVWMQQADTLL